MTTSRSAAAAAVALIATLNSVVLAGCDDQQAAPDTPAPPAVDALAAAIAAQSAQVMVGPLTSHDLGRVCRGAIASLFFHDPAIIRVNRTEAGIVYVSYNRPSDGSLWEFRCQQQGERIVWSTINADGPGTGPGRWRDDAGDEVVLFTLIGTSGVVITQRLGVRTIATDRFDIP